ncbi:UPF0332 protein [Bacteroidia bacterium]|nr:UPF0332 protein [Bacteroidia bacterium]
MSEEEERKEIINLRLQKAKDTLLDAKEIAELERWVAVANRLYYACFYASTALLLKFGHTAHTHSGVVGMIGLQFVEKNIISKEQNKFYRKMFELRQKGDYDDWITLGKADVQPLIAPAEEYICFLEQLIMQKE